MDKSCVSTLSLKVPWGHIAAKTWGDEKQTPVLVVHGIQDNAGSFDRLIARLPQNMYYVCIDLPGHGLSSHFQPGINLSYYNYILAIRYVLDELQWDTTYYMGHSLGGHLGTLFSIIYPERIRKLILIDATSSVPIKNETLVNYIRKKQDSTVEGYKLKSPREYTKDEVLYALSTLRLCYLNSEAAETLFERSVTKVGDDRYIYNRDYRLKFLLIPILNIEQIFNLLSQLKVETLIILASDTLPFLVDWRPQVINVLKNLNHVNIIEVKGNHDLHNNNPERISDQISNFLKYIPSKL